MEQNQCVYFHPYVFLPYSPISPVCDGYGHPLRLPSAFPPPLRLPSACLPPAFRLPSACLPPPRNCKCLKLVQVEGSGGGPGLAKGSATVDGGGGSAGLWYYVGDDGQAQGPVDTEQMLTWHDSGALADDLMVCKAGDDDYIPYVFLRVSACVCVCLRVSACVCVCVFLLLLLCALPALILTYPHLPRLRSPRLSLVCFHRIGLIRRCPRCERA